MSVETTIARYREALARISRSTAGRSADTESVFRMLTVEAAKALGVERVGIWFLVEDGQALYCMDQYLLSTGEHQSGARLSRAGHEPYFDALDQMRTIAAHDVAADPRTACFGTAYRDSLDVHSILDVPIVSLGTCIGVVCHETVGEQRAWTESDEVFAGSIGDLAAIAWVAARHRDAELALVDEQLRLRLALEAADMGTWTWNSTTGEVRWSNETAVLFGMPPGYQPPDSDAYMSMVLAEDRDAIAMAIRDVLENDHRMYRVQHRTQLADGSHRWIEAQGRLVPDAHGDPVLTGTARDITEQKVLQESLRQAHKMEALGRLAGGVAHDFNNLLTVIMGNVSLLEDHVVDEEGRRLLELVSASTDRAAALTGQLLSFARKRRERTDLVDLRARVHAMQALYTRLVPERVRVELDLGPEQVLPVRIDPVQLDQVLLNLVVNASEAIESAGNVAVTVRQHGPSVVLSVEDDGQGIDEATRERLFEPFFTTKASGTGLGLATCLGIVEQAGGSISVTSRVGGGTRFDVSLPVSDLAVTPDEEPLGVAEPVSLQTRVLLVEDDELVRDLVLRVLTNSGFQVDVAGDVASGLSAVESGEAIDLLVSDVVLPDGLGTQVAERLTTRHPSARVLLMSGYAPVDLPLGEAVHFLAKPFTPSVLLRSIQGLLGASGSR